jgi:hypothetical protein
LIKPGTSVPGFFHSENNGFNLRKVPKLLKISSVYTPKGSLEGE